MSGLLCAVGWLLVVGATVTAAIALAQADWLVVVAMAVCAVSVATTLVADR